MYCKYMVGVDKFDHLVSAYLTSFKSSRWYMRVFAWGWGTLCSNMYICAKQCPNLVDWYVEPEKPPKKDHHFNFLVAVGKALCNLGREEGVGGHACVSPLKSGPKAPGKKPCSGHRYKVDHSNRCDCCYKRASANGGRPAWEDFRKVTSSGGAVASTNKMCNCVIRVCYSGQKNGYWDHEKEDLKSKRWQI